MKETYRFENRNAYIKALDSVLPNNYIQERDLGGRRKHRYLPSPIKEAIADDFFHEWNVVEEKYSLICNEVVCTVKLKYMPNFPDAIEQYCTGSSSVPVQMDLGATVRDFPIKKKLNALEYNIPAVRTEAVSNALGGLGNIFGRNLSRKIGTQELDSKFTIRKHEQENDKKSD